MRMWSWSLTESRRGWRSVPLTWRASRDCAWASCGLITCWPFPEKQIRELAGSAKAFVVPELNLGQMVREVERAAGGKAKTIPVAHAGGSVHRPEDILKRLWRQRR